ncbi:MAG: PD-(D/E)XK nuclease family protein, partial [Planctomycetaceae bacterium]
PRWQAMRQIQQKYLQILDDRALWDRQMARLYAIEHKECHTQLSIVLLGTVDMNRATRLMLAQVADQVTALVHAPESWSKSFDEFGCLRAEDWQELPVDLPDQCVRVVDGPMAQADAVLEFLAERQGRFRADEISVGMADESLMPQLQRSLAQGGIVSRWGVGRSVIETEPLQLLLGVSHYLEDPRSAEFAALVRHPAIDNWLLAQGVADNMLSELDRYLARRLQPQLGEWLGKERDFHQVRQAHERIQELLEPLQDSLRSLADWVAPLQFVLQRIYASETFDELDAISHRTLSACRTLQVALMDQLSIPNSLSPRVTAAQAIRFCLSQLREEVVPPLADSEAVELLGWLELPLDDAPLVVVTSFNEGHIPGSMNSHLFLPDRLRKHLGLLDNQRRLARDAYNLTLILQSRSEICFIAGRRTESGDPLTPSRLMLSTSPAEAASRLVRFYEGADSTEVSTVPDTVETGNPSEFVVPAPHRLDELPSTLHVTSFRTYLACRYRFFLRQILRLESVDDGGNELDALGFGNLLHAVLAEFGESSVKDSESVEDVRSFLRDVLQSIAAREYGVQRLPAVDVQIAQLSQRLDAFAAWQAERIRDGWRIVMTEKRLEAHPEFLQIGGRQLSLVGRIDRIDRHL